MTWKNFKEEKPPTGKELIVQIKLAKKHEYFFISEFKRPCDVIPEVYREDYYKMKVPLDYKFFFSLNDDTWLGITSDLNIEIKWIEIPND